MKEIFKKITVYVWQYQNRLTAFKLGPIHLSFEWFTTKNILTSTSSGIYFKK